MTNPPRLVFCALALVVCLSVPRLASAREDLLLHSSVGFVTAIAASNSLDRTAGRLLGVPRYLIVISGVLVVITVGVLKETYLDQKPDGLDLAANLVGASLGAGLTYLVWEW